MYKTYKHIRFLKYSGNATFKDCQTKHDVMDILVFPVLVNFTKIKNALSQVGVSLINFALKILKYYFMIQVYIYMCIF